MGAACSACGSKSRLIVADCKRCCAALKGGRQRTFERSAQARSWTGARAGGSVTAEFAQRCRMSAHLHVRGPLPTLTCPCI